jgi:hypothetical protein
MKGNHLQRRSKERGGRAARRESAGETEVQKDSQNLAAESGWMRKELGGKGREASCGNTVALHGMLQRWQLSLDEPSGSTTIRIAAQTDFSSGYLTSTNLSPKADESGDHSLALLDMA